MFIVDLLAEICVASADFFLEDWVDWIWEGWQAVGRGIEKVGLTN